MSNSGPPYILALDIGTSGIRASIFDKRANEIPELKVKAATPFATDGSVEPDAEALLRSVIEVLDGIADEAARAGIYPDAVSVSCFWHSLVGVAADGKPTTPVLTWADTRAERQVVDLRGRLDEVSVHTLTGCHLHSSYWPAKLLYLKEDNPGVFGATRYWLSFSDLLLQEISGQYLTSTSMASGSGLFDIRQMRWDPELVDLVGITIDQLPQIQLPGDEIRSSASRWPALKDARWLPPIGDGAANNVGAGCVGKGRAALMIGTSGAMRMILEREVPENIPEGLFCYRLDEKRICLGGALSDGGSLRRWLEGSLGIVVNEEDIASRIAGRGPASHGLSFLPFVFGERSTGYHTDASGSVIGLTRGSDAIDITIAAMESVAYRFAAILSALELVCPVDRITASGGALENSAVWQQMIADVLGRDLFIYPLGGVSRRGAAMHGLDVATGTIPVPDVPEGMAVRSDPGRNESYVRAFVDHTRFYRRMFDR